MAAPTVVVLNPRSRNGATGRRWKRVEAALREHWSELQIERTRGPRDAERIAREAAEAGAGRILIAGGDGTASEVVAGLLGADLAQRVPLGFLPLGTGGDWGRTLGMPRDLGRALGLLAAGRERRFDAGRLRYRTPEGEERRSHFVNVASAGLSGFVDRLVNQAPKALGGRTSFLIGTLRGLARWRDVVCTIRVDGATVHQGPIVLATAANGRYFGGGMQVAPRARPDDGLLDVTVIEGAPKRRLLRRMPHLYRGTHLELPEVHAFQGRRVEMEPEEPWFLDVDGEFFAAREACFENLPGALRVIAAEEDRGAR